MANPNKKPDLRVSPWRGIGWYQRALATQAKALAKAENTSRRA
jgi:hypothetical protein